MSQNYELCFSSQKKFAKLFYSYLQWFFYKTSAWIFSVSPDSILTRSEMAKWQDGSRDMCRSMSVAWRQISCLRSSRRSGVFSGKLFFFVDESMGPGDVDIP